MGDSFRGTEVTTQPHLPWGLALLRPNLGLEMQGQVGQHRELSARKQPKVQPVPHLEPEEFLELR